MLSPGSTSLLSAVVLCSLNTITKEATESTGHLGRSTPDPGVGASIELGRSNPRGLFDLVGVGKTVASQGIVAEKPPPALLQVEPAGPRRNVDVLEARMLGQPGAGLGTAMTAEIIRDKEDIARRIVSFDVLQEGDVVRRVA